MTQQDFHIERSSASWFAVRTRPRRESLAQEHLERQSYETFLPQTRLPDLQRGRRGQRLAAFFPGYIFVRLDLEHDRWRPINSTLGVLHIVSFGPQPTPIPHGLIEELLLTADKDGCIGFLDQLQPGDRVRLVGGALHCFEGVFEGVSGEGRVSVLLDLMSRSVRVNAARRDVMAVR